jgi:hypothetical protein
MWMTAVFTQQGGPSGGFTVNFTGVTVTLKPKPGFAGGTRSYPAPSSSITLSSGAAVCAAASFNSGSSMLSITAGVANSGGVLLAAASMVTPSDYANYEATM